MLLQFEGHILDPARRELTRMGAIVPMEPQVFDLLLYLIRNRDRVVSKGDLIAGVWNGRIDLRSSTLATRINAARRVLGDDGKQQRFIRTAARKGIRFVGSVREEPDPGTGGAERPDASPGAPCCASWRDCVPADDPGADQTRLAPAPIVDRPSIAVLPFENMSDDRALELLADGLVEDVIGLLARVPGFFVIARASSFVYRPMSLEARQVGMELGVRYVVTGSVRGSEGRVRVTTQLIEAETGTQLWGARYDVERGDTLDLQDRIAREIITELEPALTRAELSIIRRRRTESVDAWSHIARRPASLRKADGTRRPSAKQPDTCARPSSPTLSLRWRAPCSRSTARSAQSCSCSATPRERKEMPSPKRSGRSPSIPMAPMCSAMRVARFPPSAR